MVLVSGGDIVSIPLDSWSLKVTVVTHAAVKLDYFVDSATLFGAVCLYML